MDDKTFFERVRTAVADYLSSEGCHCCQNVDEHEKHTAVLAELLKVPPYDDGSGFDFSPFETDGPHAERRTGEGGAA